MFTFSLRIGALCLVAACVVASSADAQHRGRGGGGGGGGGGSIGRSMHAAPSFRSAPSIRSAPSVQHFSAPSARHNLTTRSLRQSTPHISRSQGISRSVRHGVTGSGNVTLQKGEKGLPNVARGKGTASERAARIQSLKQNRNTAIQKSVLRNQAFVGAAKGAKGGDLARANFRGQFAGKHIGNPRWAYFDRRRHHRHFFVIGWLGPVFWPYFYDDYIDYTFWPYEYDTFWPYAYDDVYV